MPEDLCQVDILTPNVSEAEIITGRKCVEERVDKLVAADLIGRRFVPIATAVADQEKQARLDEPPKTVRFAHRHGVVPDRRQQRSNSRFQIPDPSPKPENPVRSRRQQSRQEFGCLESMSLTRLRRLRCSS